MTAPTPSKIAILGAGNIAGPYATCLARHAELRLIGVHDLDAAKRGTFAAAHGCQDYPSLDALCDDAPDIVVNLTSAPFHHATTRELISRGQTVFSEKPLALMHQEAVELVDLARQHKVRLACAPSIWLGAAQLQAAAAVRSGAAGAIRLVTAEVNQGRIELWHPTPASFYQVGPVFDVGVYPLTYLTAILGPVRSISAVSATVMPERTSLAGEPVPVATPDAWLVSAAFESGPLLRLSCNFYVSAKTVPRHIDFHGDVGSLRLEDWILPGAGTMRAAYGEPFATASEAVEQEIDWSLGVADLAAAIREDRPHRTTGEHAAHVVEILEAIAASASEGRRVPVRSSFPNPLAGL